MTDIDSIHVANAAFHGLCFFGLAIYIMVRLWQTPHEKKPKETGKSAPAHYDDANANWMTFDVLCWLAMLLCGISMFCQFGMFIQLGYIDRPHSESDMTVGSVWWLESFSQAFCFILYSLFTLFYLGMPTGWIQLVMAMITFTGFMGLGVILTYTLAAHLLFGLAGLIFLILGFVLVALKMHVRTAYGWAFALIWLILTAFYAIIMAMSWEAGFNVLVGAQRFVPILIYLILDVLTMVAVIIMLATFRVRKGEEYQKVL
jgi:hypothetical protein